MKNYKSKPLVSIIINCHNGEKYLNKSINSVLSQSYKNWEIIFWDNYSSDNSRKIIQSYKEKKIKYFKSSTFTSLYQARNQAIKKAKGTHICFLDTDDIWMKNKLKSQVHFMKSKPEYEIQYSNYFVKNEIKKIKYLKFNKKFRSGKVTQELLNYYSIGILTVFLKKSIFDNFIFDRRYSVIGDFDFFIKLSSKYKIAYVEKPLAIYRVHKNNYHSKYIHKLISELSFWIKKNKNTLNKENLSLFNQKFYLFKLRVKYILKNIFGCVVQW